jgi:hypothetical protein
VVSRPHRVLADEHRADRHDAVQPALPGCWERAARSTSSSVPAGTRSSPGRLRHGHRPSSGRRRRRRRRRVGAHVRYPRSCDEAPGDAPGPLLHSSSAYERDADPRRRRGPSMATLLCSRVRSSPRSRCCLPSPCSPTRCACCPRRRAPCWMPRPATPCSWTDARTWPDALADADHPHHRDRRSPAARPHRGRPAGGQRRLGHRRRRACDGRAGGARRTAATRRRAPGRGDDEDPEAHVIRSGNVEVDDVTYTAKLGKRTLD